MIKPPFDALAVTEPLATIRPLFEVAELNSPVVVAEVDPVKTLVVRAVLADPPGGMVPLVMTPVTVPVQTAPTGQHATYPALSAVQMALLPQQT